MCSLPIWQATLTPVPKREELEKRCTRRNLFWCMGTNSNGYIQQTTWPLSTTSPGSTPCGKREKCSDTSRNSKAKSKRQPAIMYDVFGWMAEKSTSLTNFRLFFGKQEFGEYTWTKRSGRTQKSKHPRSSMGHDEQKEYAKVILGLGRSNKYCRLPHEPVHNIRCAWGYPTRKVLWEVARSISCKNIQFTCICAHSRRKATEARS